MTIFYYDICKRWNNIEASPGFSLLKECFKEGQVTLVALAGAKRQPYSQGLSSVDGVLKAIIILTNIDIGTKIS